jgi:dihydroorotase
MALLGTYIDQRTLAALNSNASTSFAHGLGAAPHMVDVRETATNASATSFAKIQALVDATNVTLNNAGSANSQALMVTTIRFHSIMQ